MVVMEKDRTGLSDPRAREKAHHVRRVLDVEMEVRKIEPTGGDGAGLVASEPAIRWCPVIETFLVSIATSLAKRFLLIALDSSMSTAQTSITRFAVMTFLSVLRPKRRGRL